MKSTFFGRPFRRDYILKIPFLTGAPFLGWCELLCTPADGCTTFLCSTASKLRVMEFLEYNLSETTLQWLDFSFFSFFLLFFFSFFHCLFLVYCFVCFFLCFFFFILIVVRLVFPSRSCWLLIFGLGLGVGFGLWLVVRSLCRFLVLLVGCLGWLFGFLGLLCRVLFFLFLC